MKNNNNLDTAIDELVQKRVKEATESLQQELTTKDEIIATLNAGGSYTIYSGPYPFSWRTLQSNDPGIKHWLEDEVKRKTEKEKAHLRTESYRRYQKCLKIVDKYKEMEKVLISSSPWYIKLAYILKRGK